MDQDTSTVYAATTVIGPVVFHAEKATSEIWHQPLSVQMDPSSGHPMFTPLNPLMERADQVKAFDSCHVLVIGKAEKAVARTYWRALEQFRVEDSGIVKPTQDQILDLTKKDH